jgi:AAA domain/TrwC relaxase
LQAILARAAARSGGAEAGVAKGDEGPRRGPHLARCDPQGRGPLGRAVGVRGSVLRAFSRRRAEIEASLEGRGTTGARAAEAAALATRSPKDARVRAEELTDEWRARAAAFGLGDRELDFILGRFRAREPLPEEWERASRDLASPIGVTHPAPTFSRVDVIRGLCEALPAGAQVDAATLEAAAARFLSSEHAVALGDAGATDEVFRRRDGRTMPAAVHRLRYSTPAQLSLEQHVVDRVLASRGAGAACARRGDVDAAIAARPVLSSEQRRAIEALCLAGDGVAVVAGKAGTGKTFTLGAAREAWHAAGYAVLGVATARRAARELQDGAGIASTSTAAPTRRLSSGAANALPERCVLVVDEAGMVTTRDIAKLLDHVERAGGKLVLVGDDRQLPELGALAARSPTFESLGDQWLDGVERGHIGRRRGRGKPYSDTTVASMRRSWVYRLRPEFGARFAGELTEVEWQRWVDQLARQGLARSSITKHLAVASGIYAWASAPSRHRTTRSRACASHSPRRRRRCSRPSSPTTRSRTQSPSTPACAARRSTGSSGRTCSTATGSRNASP